MQIRFRPHLSRGHVEAGGWLNARHTFSFSEFYDPKWMHFSILRVINQDIIAPGGGFPPHSHRDMEIVTYVLRGAIRHRDSMGNEEVVRPGEIQVMGAGTGVEHSEFNDSKLEELELLQIWILPQAKGLPPFYGQKQLADLPEVDGMKLLVSEDGQNNSVQIRQSARIWSAKPATDRTINYQLKSKNTSAWMQIVKGTCSVDAQKLSAGDGCGFSDINELTISASAGSEFLLFDLP